MDSGKPPNTFLRKGRWFWEPPAKLRRTIEVKNQPLGTDQMIAWRVAEKLNRDLEVLRVGKNPPGTVAWVFEQFFETDKFKGLAKSTQTDYCWLAKSMSAVKIGARALGQMPARAIRARHADMIIDQIEKERSHSVAHYSARFARRVWKWAGRKEFVERAENPWAGMELRGIEGRSQRWTPEQVELAIVTAESSEWPSISIALRLAYAFGHRKGDILNLTWTELDNELRMTNKTKVLLPIPQSAYPDLMDALTAERQRQACTCDYVVRCELNGGIWQTDVFSHRFRLVADVAGLPKDLQFRDIRPTVATELDAAGADIVGINTHLGHKNMQMTRHYTRRTSDQFERAAQLREARREKGKNEPETPSELPSERRKR